MIYGWLADLSLIVHAAFILFAVAGGFLVLWRHWVAWLHLPAVLWAALVELFGWICPLTPLEIHLRALAGEAGYGGDFIGHYLWPLLYPAELTRTHQIIFGSIVVAVNVIIYGYIVARVRRKRRDR